MDSSCIRTIRYYILFLVSCTLIYQGCSSHQTETTNMQVKLIWDAQAELGEGAIWHHEEGKLFWIDIEGKKLHVFDPEARKDRTYLLDEKIGTVVPADSGGAVVALKNGIHIIDLESGTLKFLTHPGSVTPDNRYNDGKCDPAGRFWVGTIGDKNTASLYRISHKGEARKMIDSVTNSNGIVWSKDKKTMYYIDTPTKKIVAYNYDNKTGDVSNPKVVVEVPEGMGSPDGMAIDENDKLWVGHWGGSCVAQWDPVTGDMMQKISVPALNVTSCAFGGENLDKLYITTASIGMDEEQAAQYPLSGGLFVVEPGVKGVKSPFFIIED